MNGDARSAQRARLGAPSGQRDSASRAMQLDARILGGCSLRYNGRDLPEAAFKRKHARTLLLFLLLASGHQLSRDAALELLWPDGDPEQGEVNLRSVLRALRLALGIGSDDPSPLISRGRTIALATELFVQVDALLFESAATSALASGDLAALRDAAALYAGPLLPALPYEDWVSARRETLSRLHGRLLIALATVEETIDPSIAQERLRTVLSLDPTDETAARALMASLAGAGRRGEALQVYRDLVVALRRDLDLGPSAETEALHAQLPAQEASSPPVRHGRPDPSVGLPVGIVTFLLTDVEGSTALWERHPSAMEAALALHDALLAAGVAAHGGRLIKSKGEGDSAFAVFSLPVAAVEAACALQRALLAESWPPPLALRVRMALHSGEAQLRDGDYFGSTVNRCARLRALAHGGQIVLSQTTLDLVRDALPPDTGLRALGTHQLKGLQRPEPIWQLLHPSLPVAFPPVQSPQAPSTNLPAALTSFIGRVDEQRAVAVLVGKARLVTLVGPGGMGKTRLALRVAETLADAYADGVWLVELAPLADPSSLAETVATALGLPETGGVPPLTILTDHLTPRDLLLILDNCEHLIAACADLTAALLRSCPRLHILATSRETLDVAGERHYWVPPLAAPDPDRLPPLATLSGYDAVRLFVTRVQERRPDFALDAENASAVARICAGLDGLSLAIELAAARTTVLSVDAIAARLDDRFRLLTGGPRSAEARQQTLRAALDWSHELLGDAERAVFRRLSVFAGGWTLDAAEAVCRDDQDEESSVLDLLQGLVNKSLVAAEGRAGGVRYRLLETVRQYGWGHLVAGGEARGVRERHARWCLALAEQAAAARATPEQKQWAERLELEHDNLRAALTWALAPEGDALAGLHLVLALGWFWVLRSHLQEGRGWLEAVVAQTIAAPPALRAGALGLLGSLSTMQGDAQRATAALEESLRLYQELGDRMRVAASLTRLGHLAFSQGDRVRAGTLLEESLAIHRELQDDERLANVLINLGTVRHAQGDLAGAITALEESLSLFERLGDQSSIAAALTTLGEVAMARGDHAGALARFTRSLILFNGLDHKRGVAATLHCLGCVAAHLGRYQRAVHLLAAADALREQLGIPPADEDRHRQEGIESSARQALGDTGFNHAWELGRAMPLEDAVAAALAVGAE